MTLTPVEKHAAFGGDMAVFDHESQVTGCNMRFAVFTPREAARGPVPVLWYLSGLTCNWSNVIEKSGILAHAARHGLMIIAPDTSPRGKMVPDDEAYDLGQGAGFYLTATQEPWATHYRMDDYITGELTRIVADAFPADMTRQGITGHSMGGHGALTLHLKHPDTYRSVSAFAPVSSPSQVPWGQKAFTAYLGEAPNAWAAYDATELVKAHASTAHILIDTGTSDPFLAEQLRPDIFEAVCKRAGQKLTSRLQAGHDHSYYTISTFMGDHLDHHAAVLKG